MYAYLSRYGKKDDVCTILGNTRTSNIPTWTGYLQDLHTFHFYFHAQVTAFKTFSLQNSFCKLDFLTNEIKTHSWFLFWPQNMHDVNLWHFLPTFSTYLKKSHSLLSLPLPFLSFFFLHYEDELFSISLVLTFSWGFKWLREAGLKFITQRKLQVGRVFNF